MKNQKSIVLRCSVASMLICAAVPTSAADLHVFVGKCVKREQQEAAFLATLGTALLGSLVQSGLNFFGSKISQAAQAKTEESFASTNFLADSSDHPTCFQIIRGNVSADIGSPDPAFAEWAKANLGVSSAALDRLEQNGAHVIGVPDFFFEGYFRPADRNNKVQPAYAVVPLVSAFNRPAFGSQGTRGLTVTAAVFAVGDDPAKAAAALFDLGRRTPRSIETVTVPVRERTFGANASKSQPYPADDESQWIPTPFTEVRRPLTLRVRVSETRNARAFLQFVSDVYSGAKDGVAAALKTEYTPQTPEALAANLTNQSDFANKVLTARNALQAFCASRSDGSSAADRYTKGVGAQVAILNLNAAAAKIERLSPIPIVPQLNLRTQDIADGDRSCEQLLGS